MNTENKRINMKFVVVFLLIWTILPVFIEYQGIKLPYKGGGWLGFWAQHLNFISAGVVSYLIIWYQEGKDNKRFEKEIERERSEFIFETKYGMLNQFEKQCLERFTDLSRLILTYEEGSYTLEQMWIELNTTMADIADFKNSLVVWTKKETVNAKRFNTSEEIYDSYLAIQMDIGNSLFDPADSVADFMKGEKELREILLDILGHLGDIQAHMELNV